MTNRETRRLIAFSYAKQHSFRPAVKVVGRRFAKGAGKAVGQKLIKGAREYNSIRIER